MHMNGTRALRIIAFMSISIGIGILSRAAWGFVAFGIFVLIDNFAIPGPPACTSRPRRRRPRNHGAVARSGSTGECAGQDGAMAGPVAAASRRGSMSDAWQAKESTRDEVVPADNGHSNASMQAAPAVTASHCCHRELTHEGSPACLAVSRFMNTRSADEGTWPATGGGNNEAHTSSVTNRGTTNVLTVRTGGNSPGLHRD
jgi:hypothetical protein